MHGDGFVWSYLTDGDPAYTLVQVASNDLIMLFAFAPIVIVLLGVSNITVRFDVLVYAVVLYSVIPLAAGVVSRTVLPRRRGPGWFEGVFLPRLKPLSVAALLATLVPIRWCSSAGVAACHGCPGGAHGGARGGPGNSMARRAAGLPLD